jgi:hypothetical protein
MKDSATPARHLLKTGERVLGHTIAAVLGIVLMLIGLGMGVTMVMLPVGVPLGLAGLLLLLWSLQFPAAREPK